MPARCLTTPSLKMHVETTDDGVKVTGTACITKEMARMMIERYIDDPEILKKVIKPIEKEKGETVYFELDLTLKVGIE